MRKVALVLIISLACTSFSQAEEVIWYSWNEGISLAKEQNKPVIVFVHATWCHLCQRMDKKVFTDEEVASLINEYYIPVKLEAEYSGELIKGGKKYTIGEILNEITYNQFRGIPALLFIPETSNKKNSLVAGLKDPQEMMALLKKHK